MSASSVPLGPLFIASPCLTVAAAESLTCGQVQALLGAEAGASRYFLGGITTYTIEEKARFLGVDEKKARKVNAVAQDIAEDMARGVSRLFQSDIGVATTGYAETGSLPSIPEPYAFWAIAHHHRGHRYTVRSGRVSFPNRSRVEVQKAVAEHVQVELLRYLKEFRALAQGA